MFGKDTSFFGKQVEITEGKYSGIKGKVIDGYNSGTYMVYIIDHGGFPHLLIHEDYIKAIEDEE